MAKIQCPCGAYLSNCGPYTQGLLLTETEMDQIDERDGDEIDWWDRGKDIWECYSCGRLGVIMTPPPYSVVKWYSPDDGKGGDLMGPKKD